jgi:hypothetical protein
VRDRSHSENVEPRVFGTSRWWRHVSHKPARGRDMPPKYGSGHILVALYRAESLTS